MRKLLLLLSVLCLLAAPGARAEPRFFLGGGLGFVSFDDGVDEVNPVNLFVRVGVSLVRYIDIGYEGSFTIAPDEVDVGFGDADVEVDTGMFYIQGNLPVSDSGAVYVLAGRANTELTLELGGVSVSDDEDDTALGAGVQIGTGKDVYFVIDFIRYFDDDGVTSDALNAGLMKYF